MALIEFKDYPNTDTPLNAENLNHNFNELQEKIQIGTLIAQKELSENSIELFIDNLNLNPGIYKILICEFSTAGSASGHILKLNDLYGTYKTFLNVCDANWVPDKNATSGIAYVNGWQKGTLIFYTEATLFFYNKDWISVQATTTTDDLMVIQSGRCTTSIDKINKISIAAFNSDMIGKGSFIKLYKM